ncbi:MAG: HlyD family efflux transporter periplasmic adaptor subunit [Planctomycetaceae bacterium]|nr:HlyD family efflux transporter periplasmic adaptor subunit [Planctomycetaceae bacterium]
MSVDQQRPYPQSAIAPSRELSVAAYSEQFLPALRLARSSRMAYRIARVLFVMLGVTIVLMAFAPWQQSVPGTGNVVAYAPSERQQVIQSPIKGRIEQFAPGLVENAFVKKGDFIAQVVDLDEGYSGRLQQQLLNSRQSAMAAHQQLEQAHSAVDSAHLVVESLQAQVVAYSKVKSETIAAQDAFVEFAEKKVFGTEQQVFEYKSALPQLEAEQERMRVLYEEGNIALQKVQEVEAKLKAQQAKVAKAQADFEAAQSELMGKKSEREAKIQEAQVKIDYAEAELSKASQNVAKAKQDVAKSMQEAQKAEKEVLEAETKLARQETQVITAPFDGYVVQISPNAGSGVLKEGDAICTIVPATKERAVQVWVSGNDAPLIQPGRHVRLQFEGWPALQFAGWPSVAVGTFGGTVVSIDATDNGKGKFRLIVRPDRNDDPWPEDRYLRQGVRANAWVLLNRVPIWFEFWRKLNGFPPVVSEAEPDEDAKKSKPPKVPK